MLKCYARARKVVRRALSDIMSQNHPALPKKNGIRYRLKVTRAQLEGVGRGQRTNGYVS